MTRNSFEKPISLSLRKLIKKTVQALNDSLLARAGVRLVRAGRPTRNFAEFFRHVKQLGFDPQTVVDVGVAYGTDDLYVAFPRSKFYLIEPVEEFAPYITVLQSRYAIEYIKVAAGAASGQIKLNIHPDPCRTSALTRAYIEQRTVPVITLDELLLQKPCAPPVLLKLDIEGHELHVLDGAAELLQHVGLLILEVRLISYVDGLPEFTQVVDYMTAHNFVLYDILDGGYRPLDGALEMMDLVFVPGGSPLRKEKRFSADGGDW